MRFLTIFFAALFLVAAALWFFAEPGSGAGVFALIVLLLYLLVLGINKYRTGKWFTDSSGGR